MGKNHKGNSFKGYTVSYTSIETWLLLWHYLDFFRLWRFLKHTKFNIKPIIFNIKKKHKKNLTCVTFNEAFQQY